MKICVDTTVQQTVDDAYMGRVFSLYDMLFNVAYVIGPAIAIPFLPGDGQVLPVILVVGACCVTAAERWLRRAHHQEARRGNLKPLPLGPRQQFRGSPLRGRACPRTSRSSSR